MGKINFLKKYILENNIYRITIQLIKKNKNYIKKIQTRKHWYFDWMVVDYITYNNILSSLLRDPRYLSCSNRTILEISLLSSSSSDPNKSHSVYIKQQEEKRSQ
jgi:hypothetical protein